MKNRLWMLELFSGSGNMAESFRRQGINAVTIDSNKEFKPDIVADLGMWEPSELLNRKGRPLVVWASPPCQTFSVASIGRH